MQDRELACAAQHFGYWLVNPKWMGEAVAAYRAGMLTPAQPRPQIAAEHGKGKTVYLGQYADGTPRPLYSVDETGVTVLSIDGQITKGESSFGGTSSVRLRQALRRADADPDVLGIMQLVDSPGGTVAGQYELASDIYAIRTAERTPIHTHAENGMHSAALWAGVQTGRVSASPMTEIGSIGVVSVVRDYSGAFEKEGIKTHVISTGDMKGAGALGTEITDEMLAEWQSRVDEMNQFFLEAIKRGRGMGIADVRALADGRDWMARDAADKGLIDSVESFDDAMRNLRRAVRDRQQERTARSRRTTRLAKISELGG